jgi:hypothetical protein
MVSEKKSPGEKEIENKNYERLNAGPESLKTLEITKHTLERYTSLFELLKGFEQRFNVLPQKYLFRRFTGLSVDIFGGCTPDLAIESVISGQLRIVIEVKKNSPFTHKEPDASQMLSYFLYLLATTTNKSAGADDIPRAVLLAAPSAWFRNNRLSEPWNHLLNHYKPLASAFNVTLGEIHIDHLS